MWALVITALGAFLLEGKKKKKKNFMVLLSPLSHCQSLNISISVFVIKVCIQNTVSGYLDADNSLTV